MLFDDETAIIGEIAKVAKPDGSVDKLCKQILGYDRLEKVPSGPNGFAAPKYLDVLQIVSVRVGNEACQRIVDRMKDPNHFYKPSRSPVIVQYARESELYIFQRIPHIDNGRLYGGERSPNIGGYLDRDLKVGAHRFVKVKAARALINDQADSLYLATHLWAKTWPTLYGVGTSDIIIDPAKTAEALRKQYGIGRIRDVKRALDLLEEAGLAAKTVGDQWVISRKLLGRRGQRETHSIIAHRACAQNTPKSVRGRVGMHDASGRGNHIQGTLF
ncbi:MAG: hypothetical protein HOV94_30920 [Saccharothrix sp.]|nr:hypothetical protein [Saccharothrix sp.]